MTTLTDGLEEFYKDYMFQLWEHMSVEARQAGRAKIEAHGCAAFLNKDGTFNAEPKKMKARIKELRDLKDAEILKVCGDFFVNKLVKLDDEITKYKRRKN